MQASFIERSLTAWLLRQTSAGGVRKVVSASGAVASEVGNVRSENQDKAIILKFTDASDQTFVAALVADGIGGMREGSRCAAIAIGAFASCLVLSAKQGRLNPERWLEQSISAANFAVHQEYKGQGGSTLVAVVLQNGGGVHWASAGDSRLYRFSENTLLQISADDTIAGQLGKKGPVPAEHSKILQYVGMGAEFAPHFSKEPWNADDQYILTTDGVHYLSDSFDVYSRIISHSDEIGVTAKRLVDLAKWCGGPDNATVAILRLPRPPSQITAHDTENLSVWDAFGDLQVPIERGGNSAPLSETRPSHYTETEESEDVSGADISLVDNSSDEERANRPKAEPKRRRTQKKGSRHKEKPPADEAKAQLDIKFSSKSD